MQSRTQVSGQVTTTSPALQQVMTVRNISTAGHQLLGRQPGSLKTHRRSFQMLFSGLGIIPRGKVQCNRFMVAERRFRRHQEHRNRTISVPIDDARSGRSWMDVATCLSKCPGIQKTWGKGRKRRRKRRFKKTLRRKQSQEVDAGSKQTLVPVAAFNLLKTAVTNVLFPIGHYSY